MAIKSAQTNVGTTAVLLADGNEDDSREGFSFVLVNRGTVSVFLGPSNVTTATGLEVGVGESFDAILGGSDKLYAIAPSGSQRVDVIKSGVK